MIAALATAVCLVASLAGCGSAAQPVDAGPTTAVVPEYKVTVAGDSISVGLGAKLREQVPAHVVVKVIGEQGTGLARPAGFDWPARLEQLAREFPPTVLVFSVASNDAQDLLDRDGAVVSPSANEQAWDGEYSRRLAASFDAFRGTSTKIIWVGQVQTADPRIGEVNRRVHRLAEAVAASRDWVIVADLAQWLGSGERIATSCLTADGVHITVDCLGEAAAQLSAVLPGLAGSGSTIRPGLKITTSTERAAPNTTTSTTGASVARGAKVPVPTSATTVPKSTTSSRSTTSTRRTGSGASTTTTGSGTGPSIPTVTSQPR